MDKEYKFCLRCGRKLKDPEHKRIGYGPVCLEKSKHTDMKQPLFRKEN